LRPADGFEAGTCYLVVRGATDLEEHSTRNPVEPDLDVPLVNQQAEEIEYWPRMFPRS
jgi:hypothetical protein